MKKINILLVAFPILFSACIPKNNKAEEIKPNLKDDYSLSTLLPKVNIEGKIIHRGVFSPDLDEYYYTLSDTNFQNFEIYVLQKNEDSWSAPQLAIFNSRFDDHGMSFSPDGNSIYFSSTRPVPNNPNTIIWQIWKTEKLNGKWSEPEHINIPNLRNKFVSHPSLSVSGDLFFHTSETDYSEMSIYHSNQENGQFTAAEPVLIENNNPLNNTCTPYVFPDGNVLIYAKIEEHLNLMITQWDDEKKYWKTPIQFDTTINNLGKGNPYMLSDHEHLLFAAEQPQSKNWNIKMVNISYYLYGLNAN